MLVALWRHAENYKKLEGFQAYNEPDNTSGRPIDPIITTIGGLNACHVAMIARTSVMKSIKNTFILSSKWERSRMTSAAGFSAFSHASFSPEGAAAIQLESNAIDAQTAADYFSIFDFLQNTAKFCAPHRLGHPQAVILITHAHNILGQLLERFLDKDFAAYTPEELAFLDSVLNDFQSGQFGFLQNAMNKGAYEKFRHALTDPEAGHKPKYSEMRVFDMKQRRHIQTIMPPWIDYRL